MYNNSNERGVLRKDNHYQLDPNLPASKMPLTYGQTAASGPAPNTAGHHRHDILNKIDPGVDSTRDNQPIPTNQNTNGPHRSKIINALDPRVDSSAHSRQQHGLMSSGGPAPAPPPTMHGASGRPLSSHPGGGVPEGTYGPHNSRMANAMDPRVDSDGDRLRKRTHATGYQQNVPEGTYGSHSSRMGNAMDPRVDSDADRYRSSHGHTGGQYGAGANLPGPAPNTAGPHKSDLLNKLDPRVDSKGGMTYSETQRRGL